MDQPRMNAPKAAKKGKPRREDPKDVDERMGRIVGKLQDEARDREQKRRPIEVRWIEDLEQYHGVYDAKTRKRLDESESSSSIFINLTRPKTDGLSARIQDMMLPTDDRCWGIEPTPVPELTEGAAEAAERAGEAAERATEKADSGAPDADEAAEEADRAQEIADSFAEQMTEASKRAKAMADEIDDALVEGRWEAAIRDVIAEGCRLGAGVLKAPMIDPTASRAWRRGEAGFELVYGEDQKPVAKAVDPWSFFPDMDVRSIEEGRGNYERMLMNKGDLRKLARNPMFNREAIREILRHDPMDALPEYVRQVRAISTEPIDIAEKSYAVWLYTGPIDHEDLAEIADIMSDDQLSEDAQRAADDPLFEANVVAWFCQGKLLRIDPHPLDSGESLYSMFVLVRDEHSPFGYGIPRLMRDPQAAVNGASRMLVDNAAISTGPQIIMRKNSVTPQDGNWDIRPFKVWLAAGDDADVEKAFRSFNVESRSSELMALIDHFARHIDDVTAISTLSQGEQGSEITKTAQGMAMLMNSGNVVFRRVVKILDDDVIVPVIRRFYDWFMQHSKRDDIKGDYSIEARGSSVLLVREMQASNLLQLANIFGAHPIYGPMTKHSEVYREVYRSHGLRPDQFVYTDAEIKQAAKSAPPDEGAEQRKRELDLREREIEAKVEIANMESKARITVVQTQRETQMMLMAEKMNLSLAEIEAALKSARLDIESRERTFAAELAKTDEIGPTGGGSF